MPYDNYDAIDVFEMTCERWPRKIAYGDFSFFVFAKQSFSGVAYIVVVYTMMFSVASLYLHRVSSGISRLTMGQPCHSVLISPFQATAFSAFGNPIMIKEPTISIHFCWSKLQKHFIFPASRRIFHSFLGFSSKKNCFPASFQHFSQLFPHFLQRPHLGISAFSAPLTGFGMELVHLRRSINVLPSGK